MKIKLFIENFLIYGIGSVIGKLIPLVMIPIITRILPDSSYFGINDNTNALVSILSYISLMGMYDAMYRMFFDTDDTDYRKKICSTTFAYTSSLSLCICILAIIFRNKISLIFYGNDSFGYLVYIAGITTLVSATNTIVAGPARMQNKRFIYILMNTIVPLIAYSLGIFMLKIGMYTIALPLSFMIAGVINEIVFLIYNRDWFDLKKIDFSLLKPMLKFAIPLLPNFLIYWIFNSCDRLMITSEIGIAATGIYGIGSKLGNVSQLIYIAFASGWQYFAYSTMKDKNQIDDNSRLFEYLGIISILGTATICLISYLVYSFIFPAEYIEGYLVAPYLFLAPLCQMLFQVSVSQFAIIKKTWPNMLFLFGGALINLGLNYALIPRIGIEGAAIATLFGYVIATVLCVITLVKINLFRISWRFIISIIIFVGYFLTWRFFSANKILTSSILSILLLVVYLIIYRTEMKYLANKVFKIEIK